MFHDVLAMPSPIPGTVCQTSRELCRICVDLVICISPMEISPEDMFHDVLAMPSPIPGTVCLISIAFAMFCVGERCFLYFSLSFFFLLGVRR